MKALRFTPTAVLAAVAVLLAAVLFVGCGTKTETKTVTVTKEAGFIVHITSSGIPELQKDCKLSKKDRENEDHVRWINETGAKITVRFKTLWPFTGEGAGAGKKEIVIETGESSPWFTLSQTVVYGQYFYELDPIPTGTPPPTEPSVSAEP